MRFGFHVAHTALQNALLLRPKKITVMFPVTRPKVGLVDSNTFLFFF